MDIKPSVEAQSTESSSAAAIFSGSQNFTVAGGTFHSVTTNYSASLAVPSDVRRIPLGDINLQAAISLDGVSGVVDRRRRQARVCRMYAAKIDGRRATVAVYQGSGAEEEWRNTISKYSSLRHPNIIQIYAAASSNGIHAAVFHDDLIPLQYVLDANRHSPTLTAYIWARCYAEFEDAREYFRSVAKQSLVSSDCGLWMRRSSGQLCAELVPSDVSWPYLDNYPDDVAFCSTPRVPMWDKANPGMVLESLTLDGYHSICSLLLRQIRHVFLPTSAMVTLGAVFHYSPSSQFDASVQIALLPDVRIHRSGWEDQRPLVQGQNGWSRYKSDRVSSNICLTAWDAGAQLWISQANHIFNSLQITSNLNNYVLIRRIEMGLHLVEPAPTRDPPPGFLFVCPERNLQVGPSSFRWPDSPAYWSLDPLGRERLGPQEAGRLGFPTIEPFIKIQGLFWDSGVYAGLHEFHQAQGFDPDSQEIARHLGHPIYQVSNELDILVARGLDGDYLGVDDAENLEASVVLDETTPVSWNLKCWMSAHLMLILFLTLSGLYKHVGGA